MFFIYIKHNDGQNAWEGKDYATISAAQEVAEVAVRKGAMDAKVFQLVGTARTQVVFELPFKPATKK